MNQSPAKLWLLTAQGGAGTKVRRRVAPDTVQCSGDHGEWRVETVESGDHGDMESGDHGEWRLWSRGEFVTNAALLSKIL